MSAAGVVCPVFPVLSRLAEMDFEMTLQKVLVEKTVCLAKEPGL